MAASPTETQIKQSICNRMRQLAKAHNGKYKLYESFGNMKGHDWRAGYRVLYASNGEVALMPWFTIDGKYIEGIHLNGKLHLAIQEATQ